MNIKSLSIGHQIIMICHWIIQINEFRYGSLRKVFLSQIPVMKEFNQNKGFQSNRFWDYLNESCRKLLSFTRRTNDWLKSFYFWWILFITELRTGITFRSEPYRNHWLNESMKSLYWWANWYDFEFISDNLFILLDTDIVILYLKNSFSDISRWQYPNYKTSLLFLWITLICYTCRIDNNRKL